MRRDSTRHGLQASLARAVVVREVLSQLLQALPCSTSLPNVGLGAHRNIDAELSVIGCRNKGIEVPSHGLTIVHVSCFAG